MVSAIQKFCLWLVLDRSVKTGRLAPWLVGIGLGRMPHKVHGPEQNEEGG